MLDEPRRHDEEPRDDHGAVAAELRRARGNFHDPRYKPGRTSWLPFRSAHLPRVRRTAHNPDVPENAADV